MFGRRVRSSARKTWHKLIGIVFIGGAVWIIGPEINGFVNNINYGFATVLGIPEIVVKIGFASILVFIGLYYFHLKGLDY